MAWPSNSEWVIDVNDDVIKKIYTLTETTAEELKQWKPVPPPAVYHVYHDSAEFPQNTCFVRYPNNPKIKQPGGYLSLLAEDIDSVKGDDDDTITFFKGEKNLQEEAKDKSNSEKAQLENKEFLKNFKEEVEQLLAGIEYFESLNNRIEIEMNKIVAASDAPEWSKDNIFTLDVMEEPVTANDGFTYEKANILAWFGTNNTSPTTGAVIRNKELTPNHSLKSHINQWSEAQAKSVKEKHRYGIEFLKNDEILQKLRTRLNELRTINEGIFKKYETVPTWNDLIKFKPRAVSDRSKLRKLLFGQTNPDNLNAGGKKGSTRTTRKTRKRNVRGRRRTNNRRHLHRRNAKK